MVIGILPVGNLYWLAAWWHYATGAEFTNGTPAPENHHMVLGIIDPGPLPIGTLSIEVLFELIRSYSRKNAALYPEFLRSILEAFHQHLDRFFEDIRPDATPQETFGRIWNQNIKLMESLMGGWMDREDASAAEPDIPPTGDATP